MDFMWTPKFDDLIHNGQEIQHYRKVPKLKVTFILICGTSWFHSCTWRALLHVRKLGWNNHCLVSKNDASSGLLAPQIATANQGGARWTQENDKYKLLRRYVSPTCTCSDTDLKYFTLVFLYQKKNPKFIIIMILKLKGYWGYDFSASKILCLMTWLTKISWSKTADRDCARSS